MHYLYRRDNKYFACDDNERKILVDDPLQAHVFDRKSKDYECINIYDILPINLCLRYDRIVHFYADGVGIVVEECCDDFFKVQLTKDQLSRLIEELKQLL